MSREHTKEEKIKFALILVSSGGYCNKHKIEEKLRTKIVCRECPLKVSLLKVSIVHPLYCSNTMAFEKAKEFISSLSTEELLGI
jgi:hypothetical protein